MRVDRDIRKTVVFFGYEAGPEKGGIDCIGTGFLQVFEGEGYLVTAKHITDELGDMPFLIRVNRKDGTSENLHADGVRWIGHPDPTVDVAVIPFNLTQRPLYDIKYLPQKMLALDELVHHQVEAIGTGDFAYTVGLWRLMSGTQRNLPVVHTGSIAMIAGEEKIPVQDWRDPDRRKTLYVDGHLVESSNLSGLSGSPVFVRQTTLIPYGSRGIALAGKLEPFLFGLWQSSWDAPPGQVLGFEVGKNVRVPVGMGVVVPAQKIVDTLNQPELVEMRKQVKQFREAMKAPDAMKPGGNSGS